ncbi:hypothetical protein [Rubellimicrobium aerolatum]|uniref:Uncharacterized protein n=1 Tax=Rubellimicrobium aerolatum TaxID=490979 RepID=A0ABW0SD76_9RHOB|nr:hypothetical protein [Rubellimicrobium aerolatum]MBP1806725.1 hypothetical protein [Rubellimicrobium aerolatum]
MRPFAVLLWIARRLPRLVLRTAWAMAVLAFLLGTTLASLATALSPVLLAAVSEAVEAVLPGRSAAARIEGLRRAELAGLREAQADEFAALERRHRAELDGLRRSHADDMAGLNRRAAAQADEIAALRSRGAAVRGAVDRIVARSVRVQAANIGSMAGEALPVLGVAVIAATTAYEVKSTCDTVEDLIALDRVFNPDREIDPREVCGLPVPTADEVWAAAASSPAKVWTSMKETWPDSVPDPGWPASLDWLFPPSRSIEGWFFGREPA